MGKLGIFLSRVLYVIFKSCGCFVTHFGYFFNPEISKITQMGLKRGDFIVVFENAFTVRHPVLGRFSASIVHTRCKGIIHEYSTDY